MLTDAQIERYSRQIILPQVGGRGQAALLSATVMICGRGELAMTAGLYLAAAGAGHLHVSPQIAAALDGVNPDCHVACLAPEAADAVHSVAVVLCAGATAATGAVLHAACVAAGVPVIVAEATDTTAWMSVCAGAVPCYGCLTRRRGRIGGEATPLGNVAAGCVGTMLATEAIKIIIGLRPSFVGHCVTFDVLTGDVRDELVMADPGCAGCGKAVTRDEKRGIVRSDK